MSPEQAKGRAVDRRTDIFAFGCVLYEMLTGRPAFDGDDVGEILARVIEREPDWSKLPSKLPPRIRELLRRCMEKDPKKRRRDAGDLRIDIEQGLGEPRTAAHRAPVARLSWIVTTVAVLLALLLAIPAVRYLRESAPSLQVMRFTAELGEDVKLAYAYTNAPGMSLGPAAFLSHDGKVLAFAARKPGSETTQLYVRPLDQLKASPLAGTDGARDAFFSPDGRWIAFFADGKLKKISVTGGASVALCEAPTDREGTWTGDGWIIFAPNGQSGLWRVSSNGGTPESFTKLDVSAGETTHRWPQAVPGAEAVLFIANKGTDFENANIMAQSLRTGERKLVQRGGYQPYYLPSGHLVYVHEATLFAAPFNLDRLEMTAPPVPVLEGVTGGPTYGASQLAFSENGTLIYLSGAGGNLSSSLVWVDRKGMPQPLPAPARRYANPRLSPDGRRLALSVVEGTNQDIWTYDLTRDVLTRLSFDGATNGYPLWTPDGKRVAYRKGGPPNVYWKAADGSGAEERLTSSEYLQTPMSFSPDGRTFVYGQQNPKTSYDVFAMMLEGDRKPRTILQTPFEDRTAQFSPDGRWLAYVSNESGRFEVYIQPFPGPGGKQQISSEGGAEIFWAKNGELFYRTGANREMMMAVDVGTQPTLRIGKARLLFEGAYLDNAANGAYSPNYSVSADGQRFLMLKASEPVQSGPAQINVVLNWFEERAPQ